MGSRDEASSIVRRHTVALKAAKPQVESLKTFVAMMTNIRLMNFRNKYGKILELLEVEVQVEAITALGQYYDVDMRCFTFQDFQMAPTLEEFAEILGYSLENIKPYRYSVNNSSLQKIANVLRVQRQELEDMMQNRSGHQGFPQKYLEERMKHLAEIKDWISFMDILALTVYGVILFPHIPEYIDLVAIDVFLAFKDRGESPVPAVLADTYLTFHYCCQKKGKKLVCCLPVLYVWLTTHVFKNNCRVSCPIQDFKMCNVTVMNSRQWAQTLAGLNEKTVRWFPQWRERHEVIYQCGKFSNVPLMGTKGCINYNPCLVIRQLGYPMREPPTDKMTDPLLVLYDDVKKNSARLQDVHQAWTKVVRKSKDLSKRRHDTEESYCQWLKNRIQKVKLPFHHSIPIVEETVDETPISLEVVEELKAALLKSEEENKKLHEKLEEVLREKEAMHLENKALQLKYNHLSEIANTEEKYKSKLQNCMRAANEELKLRRKERDEAYVEIQKWKEKLTESKMTERNLQRHLEDLKQQLQKGSG